MNPKEMVFAAMEMRKPDRPPVAPFGCGVWTIYRSGTTFRELSQDPERMARTNLEIYRKYKPDIVYVGSGYNNLQAAALGGKIKFREIGAPDLEEPYIQKIEDIEKLDLGRIPSDPVIQTIWKALRMVKKEIGHEVVVTMTSWGPFTLAAQLVGVEQMMRATFKDKALVEAACAFAVRMLEAIYAPVIEDGTLEMITMADPTASGDLISRKQFEKFALPPLQSMSKWAHDKKVKVLLHICGDTNSRLDLFPLTGVDCISLDHKVDIAKAKAEIGNKMCIAGNMNPVAGLERSTMETVRVEAQRCLDLAAADGGFILMPGCDHPPTVPEENLKIFYETAKNYKYQETR
jgi:uroporphyrinogen decarboxylase